MTDPQTLARLKTSALRNARNVLSLMRGEGSLTSAGASEKAFLDWTEMDRIRVQKIDEQHKQLVNLINRFHAVLLVERNRAEANHVFHHFIHSARNHFLYEEALLIDQRCPGYQAHFDQHSDAIVQVQELYRQFVNRSLSATVLLSRLRQWMIGHTRELDRSQASWLNQIGVGSS